MARRHVRAVAAGLILALSGTSPGAAAPARRPRPPAPAPAPDPLVKVAALAQEAQTRFETADYEGAIDLWTQAYAALPVDPEYGQQRSVLAYQIAQACVEAYAIDPRLVYLRKAARLFEGYQATIDPSDHENVAAVQRELDALKAKIEEAERRERESVEAERERLAEAERERLAAAEREEAERRRQEAEAEHAQQMEVKREVQRWRARTMAGGVLLGVGAVGVGLMGYGLAWGASVDRRGEAAVAAGADTAALRELLDEGVVANRLAVGAAIAGGALVLTGVGLVAAGTAGQRRARRGVAAAPTWLPGGAGLVLRGSF